FTAGIDLFASTDWIINENSFYQTATRNYGSNVQTIPIYFEIVSNLGDNFQVTNNYIGGTAPQAGGSPLTMTGGVIFHGMYLSAGTSAPNIVSNNIIQNI